MNTAIIFKEEKKPDKEQVLRLYNDAGWQAYTNKPDVLMSAIHNSLYVLTARKHEELLGLIRIVGDGKTIIYIQDILVLRKYKRQGIGTHILNRALKRFKNVRQKVLLTDESEETRGFYEALGFRSCDKGGLVAFVKLESQ